MNTILHSHTSHLRPSRTIDTVVLDNGLRLMVVYVYNYEGVHFRVFDDVREILGFFEGNGQPIADFEDERDLDCFLLNLDMDAAGPNYVL